MLKTTSICALLTATQGQATSEGCMHFTEGANESSSSERLVEMRSRVESMLALREKGIDALFSSLDSVLPQLVASGMSPILQFKPCKRLIPPNHLFERSVIGKAARQLCMEL